VVAAKLIDVRIEGRQHIDRYELVAEVASGGMATVFLARLSGMGGFQKFVAIKRLHPHLAGEREFVEMFLDEARLAAGIHHPNVVSILEVGASERGYYLAMEYVEGDTLARLLARAATSGQRLPRPVSLKIVLDTLTGLHAAHELKDEMGQPTELVHRDVSPQNVLVGLDGICRITDFGVARAASRLSATRVGQLKGKIAYMAPEQAMGKSDIDRRADVFAAGIMLWEVLAGRRLFKSENEAATLSRVLTEEITHVCEVATDVPRAIGDVAMKALERVPSARYPTCAHFADALERAALEADKVASGRELAAYVSEVIGNEIAQQREAVRGWLARSEPSQIQFPTAEMIQADRTDRSGVTQMATPSARSAVIAAPPPKRSRGWLIAAGVLSLCGVAVVAWWIGSRNRDATPVTPAAATAATTAPQPTASVPAPPEASASAATPTDPPAVEPSALAPTPTRPRPQPSRPHVRPPTPKPGGEDLPSNPYR
jgi:serine/threonine-protein kinase